MQRDTLLQTVQQAYAAAPNAAHPNEVVYQAVADSLGDTELLDRTEPVGSDQQPVNTFKREVRWIQQELRRCSVLERVPEKRGVWRLTREGKRLLSAPVGGAALLGYRTDLGVAIWGDARPALKGLEGPVALCLTSPPYPLANPRAYGNPSEQDYIDFICATLEPIVAALDEGGSVVLNISNDIFESGSPARSLYKERLVVALNERLGLEKMDELPWISNKIPGPTHWCSKTRQQLRVTWEPVLWFAYNPHAVKADNRRVLEAHSERMERIIAQGGDANQRAFGDEVNKSRSFDRATEGKIPTNALHIGHTCASQREAKALAAEAGLPEHSAPFPLSLPRFLIEWLTERGDLVVDPMAGSGTVAVAAEQLERRWLTCERYGEYVAGAGLRHQAQVAGATRINPDLWEQIVSEANPLQGALL